MWGEWEWEWECGGGGEGLLGYIWDGRVMVEVEVEVGENLGLRILRLGEEYNKNMK